MKGILRPGRNPEESTIGETLREDEVGVLRSFRSHGYVGTVGPLSVLVLVLRDTKVGTVLRQLRRLGVSFQSFGPRRRQSHLRTHPDGVKEDDLACKTYYLRPPSL